MTVKFSNVKSPLWIWNIDCGNNSWHVLAKCVLFHFMDDIFHVKLKKLPDYCPKALCFIKGSFWFSLFIFQNERNISSFQISWHSSYMSCPSAHWAVYRLWRVHPNFMEGLAMESWWFEPLLVCELPPLLISWCSTDRVPKYTFLPCLPVTATVQSWGSWKLNIQSPSNCFNKMVVRICHDKHIYCLLINCIQGQFLLLNYTFSMTYCIFPGPNIKIAFLSIMIIIWF